MIGNIDILVKELCKLPKEVGWVEFKHNNCEPTMVGEDISALANSATLNDRDYAYMIWGVDDGTHEIIGTKVRLQLEKKGEQEEVKQMFQIESVDENTGLQRMQVSNIKQEISCKGKDNS